MMQAISRRMFAAEARVEELEQELAGLEAARESEQ